MKDKLCPEAVVQLVEVMLIIVILKNAQPAREALSTLAMPQTVHLQIVNLEAEVQSIVVMPKTALLQSVPMGNTVMEELFTWEMSLIQYL